MKKFPWNKISYKTNFEQISRKKCRCFLKENRRWLKIFYKKKNSPKKILKEKHQKNISLKKRNRYMKICSQNKISRKKWTKNFHQKKNFIQKNYHRKRFSFKKIGWKKIHKKQITDKEKSSKKQIFHTHSMITFMNKNNFLYNFFSLM